MFPLRDSHPTYKFPLITIILIIANVIIFFLELTVADPIAFIENYALIPSRVSIADLYSWTPFVTSQFLHAGFLHILSNMWFLRVFGDNVEERFGHLFFLFVYLTSGIFGGVLQYLFSPGSDIPMIGASGAVAGVLGAYLVFFPHHKVKTLIPLGFFWTTMNISASFMLVYWFVIQLFSGLGSIADTQTGGIAFWAHVGGFVTGYVIAKTHKGLRRDKVEEGDILIKDF
jgi:membrane associated rhomboid family serine protease